MQLDWLNLGSKNDFAINIIVEKTFQEEYF